MGELVVRMCTVGVSVSVPIVIVTVGESKVPLIWWVGSLISAM